MTSCVPPGRRLSRRRFLQATALATGGASIGALAYLVEHPPGSVMPGADAGQPSPGSVVPSPPPSVDPAANRQHFRSRGDLTPPLFSVRTLADGVAPGYLFFTPGNGAYSDGPTITDDRGELVWLRPDAGPQAANFVVAHLGGRPVLTWWEGRIDRGIGAGEYVVVDETYRRIARIRAAGAMADLHELVITPRDTAFLFAYATVPRDRVVTAADPLPFAGSTASGGPPGASGSGSGSGLSPTPPPPVVVDGVIQEIDVASGRLLFEWHTADHIPLDESVLDPATMPGSPWDYAHLNSIELDGDGHLLVSARNTSAIYRIDLATGAIVWRLGGRRSDFTIGEGGTFGFQHDARRHADGSVTLFDNEAEPSRSRALALRLDETAMIATPAWSLAQSSPGLSTSQGNVQRLSNGNWHVGWGSQPNVSEFSADGRLIYDATYLAGAQSYRHRRFEWVGRPVERPSMAIEPSGAGRFTVFVSCNGATDVADWEILAGPDAGRLKVVARAARSGFETAITVEALGPLVAARALDRAGSIIGTSLVRRI